MPHALLVEDDQGTLNALNGLVQAEGFTTSLATNLGDARSLASQEVADIALVDLNLPDGSGLELFEGLNLAHPTPMVLMTGDASVPTAVEALRRGIHDYMLKPIDLDRLRAHLDNVSSARSQEGMRQRFREISGADRFGPLVGRSATMQRLYHLIGRVAGSEAPVLIQGESGSGKELVARTIHDLSRRSSGSFVTLNCGAVPEHLVESELFGHEKGSFTGAHRTHHGVFERAHGGTLLLDEIGEMPLDLQTRLLRTLEDGTFHRVGGEKSLRSNARVVAATHNNLVEAVEKGRFREDLYYRLHVVPIFVPPLRDRGDDVQLLAETFLGELNAELDQPKPFTPELLDQLKALPWPGNVRQLRNAVYRLHLLADDKIGTDLLPADGPRTGSARDDGRLKVSPDMTLAEAERHLIEAVLERFDGHRARSAESLGVSLKTLYNRLKAYRIADQVQQPS